MADPSLSEQFAAAQAEADAWESAHPEQAKHMARAAGDETEEPSAEAESTEQPAEGEQVEDAADETDSTEAPEKPKTEEAADPAKAKRDQLAALAAELGMKVDGNQVITGDRAQWRAEKRKEREQIAKAQSELQRVYVQQVEPVLKGKALLEEGDIDAGLKALTGKDLTELNKDAIAAASGADWQTRQRLRKLESEREAERAQLAQWQQQEQQRQQAERDRQYEAHLRGELTKSEDKTVAAVSTGFDEFAGWVAAEQRRELDPEDGSTILPAVAARRVVDNMRSMYERLHKIFGAPGAPKKPESGVQAPEKPAQPRNGKPPARTNAAAGGLVAGRRSAPTSDDEWWKTAKKEMDEAARSESRH